MSPFSPVDHIRRTLSRFAHDPASAALVEAHEAARRGDSNGVALALSKLDEPERYLSTVAFGVLHPEASGPPALALDAALAASTVRLDWNTFASADLVSAWARVLLGRMDPLLVIRLVGHAPAVPCAGVLGTLADAAIEGGRVAVARLMLDSIGGPARADRARVRARLALLSGDNAELDQALLDAAAAPAVEDGSHEVEALAKLLEVLVVLPSGHPAVRKAVTSIEELMQRHKRKRDTRSHWTGLATVACARTATPADPGWARLAERLRNATESRRTESPTPRELANEAVYRAWARLRGETPDEPTLPARLIWDGPPPLDRLRTEAQFDRRALVASPYLLRAAERGDVEAVRETLSMAVAPTVPRSAGPTELGLWATALVDGGDLDAAAERIAAVLRGGEVSAELVTAAQRLTGAPAHNVIATAVEHSMTAAYWSRQGSARKPLIGVLAQLAAGSEEIEDVVLRAALVVEQGHEWGTAEGAAVERARRIAAVLEVLSDANRGEPERLDHWERILGDADRVHLAAAASLLAPLGLAEIERRWGPVASAEPVSAPLPGNPDPVQLVRALAEAGHIPDALLVASRLEPDEQQRALVAAAQTRPAADHARAILAAFRACPKGGRDRDQQVIYQHRCARVLLALGRVDEAVQLLSRMRDCRVSSYGPARLALELVQWLDAHRDEADPRRLRTLIEVLAGDKVIPQELAAEADGVVSGVYQLADEQLRAEIVDVHVPRLRHRLGPADGAVVEAGLASGLATVGRFEAAATVLSGAVVAVRRGPRSFFRPWPFVTAAVQAELSSRDPKLFAEVFETVAVLSPIRPRVELDVAVDLGAAGRAAAAQLLNAIPDDRADRWVTALADACANSTEGVNDLDTLLWLLRHSQNEGTALTISRRIAAKLARQRDLPNARAAAAECGLIAMQPIAPCR